MSKSEERALKKAQGDQENDSVFDFLYHDSRRIASFLSQFDNNGLLTGLTQGESASKGSKRGKKIELGGNTPLGGGTIGLELGPGESGSESLERVYDPFWANARQFLDVIEDRGMLNRDVTNANIGQFVIASGYLSIQDLGMLKEAWKAPSIQKQVTGGAGGGKKVANMTAAQKSAAQEEKNNMQVFLDLIQIMPHSVHARMLSSTGESTSLIWSVLNQGNLVLPASDIALTYGDTMDGKWSIMGILSAQPEYLTPDLVGEFDQNDMGMTQSLIGQISKILAPIVRVTLGRPAAAYAVTPLLIFREVS